MSISANFPNVFPSLELNFAQGQQLDPRVTFSRSTTAPYYDGKTSVLAEQNLTVQSQDWTQSVWTKTGLTATANNWVAPDGTTTGTLLTSTTSTAGSTGTYQSITFAIGSTISFYATAGTANFIGATVGGVGCYANFNLGTGAVASSTGCTPSMVSIGGGTYRCIIANTSISGTLIILTGKDADPAASPWTNGVWTSGNTVKVWGFQVENRSSPTAYNATTTSAITNYIPQLLTAPINAPRFDFNPTTGESLGLLIEQSSTNTILQSQFASGWGSYNPTLTQSANIAPDGTQTAVLMNSAIATGNQGIYRTSIAISASTSYTYSIYAKAGSANYVGISQSAANQGVIFNLSNGTFSANIVSAPASYSIASVGNGWYRCSITLGTNANTSTNVFVWVSENGTSTSYTGTGLGIYIWGAQLEALAFSTSYISTTSAQVTRASDNASMTGTNFSSWYNQGQGTVYSEAKCFGISSASLIGQLYASATNYIDVGRYQSTLKSVIISNGSTVATLDTGLAINSFNKFSVSYANNSYNASGNGGTVQTSSSGLVPSGINTLNIGNYQGNNLYLNGWIKKMAFYPIAFTGSQNQSLTGI